MTRKQPERESRRTIRISVPELQDQLTAAFLKCGLSAEAATHSAEALVEAECAGKPSHGLIRIDFVNSHTLLKQPGPVTIGASGPCHLAVDGNRHMGYHPGVLALERGCDIASKTGLCLVAIHNIGHSGMLAFYAHRRPQRLGLGADGPTTLRCPGWRCTTAREIHRLSPKHCSMEWM
jgi:LDH2 family malate/lactate/ureidoglycolate dehydrogenase